MRWVLFWIEKNYFFCLFSCYFFGKFVYLYSNNKKSIHTFNDTDVT